MSDFRRYLVIARRLLTALAAILVVDSVLWAHEGHAPLPTKGTLVDVKQETVFLTPEARTALDVETEEVDLQPLEQTILAYATLESPWTKHAFATSRLGGRIDKLFVKPGQAVSAGDVLAEVQSLELENLQLELLNAANDTALSERLLKQQEILSREGVIAGRDFLEATATHTENKIALRVARLKLMSLGWSEEDLDDFVRVASSTSTRPVRITSPISGVVIHADLTIGKVVEPNEHLFEIVDASSVWVKLGILEKDIQRVAVRQPVDLQLAAYPNRTFRCKVQVKNLALDPETRLATAWAELHNPRDQEPTFLPGMYGQAKIVVLSPGKRVAVPTAAVVGEGAERFVFVEEEATQRGSQFRKRNVVVEHVTPQLTFLRDGNVFPGDRVLTQGSHVLAPYFAGGVLRLSDEAKENIRLRLDQVAPRVVEKTMELEGIVDVPPDHRSLVSSQLAGTLERIRIDRDQVVRTGEVVAELASLEFQNLQLEMLQADQQVKLLGDLKTRLEGLGDTQAVARRRLWEIDSSYNAALQRRESLRRKLEAVGLEHQQIDTVLAKQTILPNLPLRASIDGAIVHFDKVLGQAIKAEEPLFEIHDLSRVWVRGFLTEREAAEVHFDPAHPLPARVRLSADPDTVATGKVVRSGGVLGVENRTLAIWVELDEPPTTPWAHNLLARITLTLDQSPPTLAVPLESVTWEGTRAYVFVEQVDGRIDRRLVQTGRADDRYIEITAGLTAGDIIAVHGASDLQTAYAALR